MEKSVDHYTELKPSVKATFIEKDLLMVRARFGKRLQVLKAGAAKEAGECQ